MTARLAKKLGKLRTARKLSPQFVGEKLGVHPINLKKWERARERPDHDTLIKLAEIYDVPVEEFTSLIEMEDAYDNTFWGKIPFATIVVLAYMFFGFSTGAWHPYWVILLTVPAYRKVGEYLLIAGMLPQLPPKE